MLSRRFLLLSRQGEALMCTRPVCKVLTVSAQLRQLIQLHSWVTSSFVVFLFHFSLFFFVLNQLLLAANVSDYHPTLRLNTRCSVRSVRSHTNGNKIELTDIAGRMLTLEVWQLLVVGFDCSLWHFLIFDRGGWGTSRWQVGCSQHSWIRTDQNAETLETPIGLIATAFVCNWVHATERKTGWLAESIWDFIFQETFEHDSLTTCPDTQEIND